MTTTTITRAKLIRELAPLFKLSIPAMAKKVTDVSTELELGSNTTRYSLRMAGEIEGVIARDIKTGK